MANISEEKWIEMLEKKADGTFVAKYPKVKSKSGVTFDEHENNKTTAHGGIIKFEQGSYAGNGGNNRLISTSFTPKLVIVGNYSTYTPDPSVFAIAQPNVNFITGYTGHTNATEGYRIFNQAQQHGTISIVTNGFQVSDSTKLIESLNFTGKTYYYTIIG